MLQRFECVIRPQTFERNRMDGSSERLLERFGNSAEGGDDMEGLSPEVIASLTITSGVALGMVWLAKHKKMLEDRSPGKRCPSCGLVVRANGSCNCVD